MCNSKGKRNDQKPNWNARFIDLALHVAGWSKDPSTQVGAVIVRDKQVLAMGYNGFPRGVDDSDERYDDRPTKYSLVVHAELNAILNATADIRGANIYVTHFPCGECAKSIIQSGIATVYYPPEAKLDRWHEGNELAEKMFLEAGVGVMKALRKS